MAATFVEIDNATDPGAKVKTFETVDGGDTVESQAMVIVDAATGDPVPAPLTDDELRAAPVPVTVDNASLSVDDGGDSLTVDGTVAVTDGGGSITVDGPLTDTQLRAVAVPVSAAALPLPAGAATAALQTQPGVDIGDVTVNNAAGAAAVNIQDGGNSITVDAAALPLPAGAATAAKQDEQSGYLSLIEQDISVSVVAGIGTSNTFLEFIHNNIEDFVVPSLDAIEGYTSSLNTPLSTLLADATFTGRINTQGQKTMAASTPVVIASDQSAVKVQGNAVDGAAVSGNPVLVAGQDGTNVQSLKTNATGQLETVVEAGSSSGTLGALNAAVTLAVGSNRSFGFALSGGPLTSGTLVAEQSFDGGATWVQTLFINSIVTQVLTGLAASGSFINPTGAEFGSFLVDGGVTHVRIRVSAYASGSVTGLVVSDVADVAAARISLAMGYPSLSAAGMGMMVGGTDATTFRAFRTDSSGRQIAIGAAADGAAVTGNPVLTAGQDGTNVQSIKTDTIGRQEMVGAAADGAAVTGAPVLIGGSDGANAQSLLVDTSGRPMTVGAAASDAPVAGNPVLVAGRASVAAPADVSGDGDAVTAWYLRNGAAAAVITAAGALIGGDAANGLDVDVTRVPADPFGLNADAASATGSISAKLRSIAAVQLPAALVGGRLDGNTGAWLGSTAPTVGQKTMANSLPVVLASDQSNIVVVSPTPLFVGRACTFRTPGRAGTGGQKILSLHNATGSAVTVTVKKVIVDLYQTVIKAITVAPPIIRLWKVTVLPTNGTALTKNKIGGSTTSNASVTVLGDASVDGTGSGTTLTATLPAGTFITQECAPRFITAAGYEVSDRIEWLGDTEVVLAALEGVVVYLDYTAATQNPVTDMWIAGVEWKES